MNRTKNQKKNMPRTVKPTIQCDTLRLRRFDLGHLNWTNQLTPVSSANLLEGVLDSGVFQVWNAGSTRQNTTLSRPPVSMHHNILLVLISRAPHSREGEREKRQKQLGHGRSGWRFSCPRRRIRRVPDSKKRPRASFLFPAEVLCPSAASRRPPGDTGPGSRKCSWSIGPVERLGYPNSFQVSFRGSLPTNKGVRKGTTVKT